MTDQAQVTAAAGRGPLQELRRGQKTLPAIVAAVVGMALYAITLGGTYIYDDVYHLFDDDRARPTQLVIVQPPPQGSTVADLAPVQQVRSAPPAIEDPRQWNRYLTESYNDGVDNLYRPLTSLTFAIQATIHGRSESAAWAWHLVNVLLYGIVCAQVALLAGGMAQVEESRAGEMTLRVSAPRASLAHSAGWISLAAGVLFAVHPVHAEVVAGIVGRAELICAIGFLGGLMVIMRPLSPMRIAAFVALMLFSIGGKEQGLVLPVVALAWYLSRRWADLPSLTQWSRQATEARSAEVLDDAAISSLGYEPRTVVGAAADLGKIMFVIVAIALAGYLIAREQWLKLSIAWPVSLLDPTIQPMRDAAGADRWLMPVALAGRYLHLLFWPGALSIDYGSVVIEPPQRLEDFYLWLGVLAMVLFAAAVIHALVKRWAAGLTLLAGFAVSYGIVSNFLTIIGTVMGERLLFLPSAFLLIYVVLLAFRLVVGVSAASEEWPRGTGHGFGMGRLSARSRVVLGVAAVLACLAMARTFTYAMRWNDRAGFYEYQSRVQPRSVRIWMLLGEELRQRGRLEEAAFAAAQATDLKPDYWSNWVLRANVALDRGRLQEALEYAERAVAVRTSLTTTSVRAKIDNALMERRRQQEATRPATEPATQSPGQPLGRP